MSVADYCPSVLFGFWMTWIFSFYWREMIRRPQRMEKHRQRLMEKLGIHEIAGLTRFAIATGVVESRGKLPSRD